MGNNLALRSILRFCANYGEQHGINRNIQRSQIVAGNESPTVMPISELLHRFASFDPYQLSFDLGFPISRKFGTVFVPISQQELT